MQNALISELLSRMIKPNVVNLPSSPSAERQMIHESQINSIMSKMLTTGHQ